MNFGCWSLYAITQRVSKHSVVLLPGCGPHATRFHLNDKTTTTLLLLYTYSRPMVSPPPSHSQLVFNWPWAVLALDHSLKNILKGIRKRERESICYECECFYQFVFPPSLPPPTYPSPSFFGRPLWGPPPILFSFLHDFLARKYTIHISTIMYF